MLKKKTSIKFVNIKIYFLFCYIFTSPIFAETILLSGCENGRDGFKENNYKLNIEKSLMTMNFTYDLKTFKKHRLTDIKTKKKNSINRFIYLEGNKIFTDKIGYPKFYTQLIFEKDSLLVKIKTVINDEVGIQEISKCKKIDKFQSTS